MAIRCTQEGRTLTAMILGELDHHGAKEVMEELERQIDASLPQKLILNLKGVTFTDSSGIAVLLRAWRHIGRLGGSMSVVETPQQAKRVFSAGGLDRLISFDRKEENCT